MNLLSGRKSGRKEVSVMIDSTTLLTSTANNGKFLQFEFQPVQLSFMNRTISYFPHCMIYDCLRKKISRMQFILEKRLAWNFVVNSEKTENYCDSFGINRKPNVLIVSRFTSDINYRELWWAMSLKVSEVQQFKHWNLFRKSQLTDTKTGKLQSGLEKVKILSAC